MSVTLNFRPETQARLQVQAAAAGMSLEEYLLAAERTAAWIEAAGRFPDTPPLSDEAVSRENMYADCE
jgi:hypothetical protein